VRYGFEILVGKDQYDWRDDWSRQYIIGEVFMLYQSIDETWNNSCELHHTRVKCCTTILLSNVTTVTLKWYVQHLDIG
jgi:hypothetical protein